MNPEHIHMFQFRNQTTNSTLCQLKSVFIQTWYFSNVQLKNGGANGQLIPYDIFGYDIENILLCNSKSI